MLACLLLLSYDNSNGVVGMGPYCEQPFAGREVSCMNLELADNQKGMIRHALEVYLSDLRVDIVKTEKHEWKKGLHDEEAVLKRQSKSLPLTTGSEKGLVFCPGHTCRGYF